MVLFLNILEMYEKKKGKKIVLKKSDFDSALGIQILTMFWSWCCANMPGWGR